MRLLALIALTSFICISSDNIYANSIDIISEHIVNDLTRKFQSSENDSRGTRYISVLPLEVKGSAFSKVVAKKLCNSLSESFSRSSHFLMVELGDGPIYHSQKDNDNSFLSESFLSIFRKKYNNYLYITGSLHESNESYIATIHLVDASLGKRVASKSFRLFSEDVKNVSKKEEAVSGNSSNSMSLTFSDSYMESPLNIMAKLNDIYISYFFTNSLNVNLGITNLYLHQNSDMALMADEIYPHLLSSSAESYNNFNPIYYTQFTQVVINKCMPYIGVNYCTKINEFISLNLSMNATFFILQIPVGQDVFLNPYAEFFNNNNDAATVLSGNMKFNTMNINYPQVMFRLSANPTFAVSSNTFLGLYMSFYYTPMKVDIDKSAPLPDNGSSSTYNSAESFGIERAMMFSMSDLSFIGVSINFSIKRLL